jgi:hypothetical protein
MDEFRKMPQEVQEVFEDLHNDLVWLQIHFEWYNCLFDQGPKRLELLDAIASTFFVRLKFTLFEDIVLSIARLLDPSRSRAFERMSLAQLAERVTADDKAFGAELDAELNRIKKESHNIRDLRNSRIAHKDLKDSLKESPELTKISKSNIEQVLTDIGALMNKVSDRYGGPGTLYENAMSQAGADTFVERLKEAAFLNERYKKDPEFWYPILERHRFRDA